MIRKYTRNVVSAIKETHRKSFYLLLSGGIFLGLVALNAIILNYRFYLTAPSFEAVWKVFLGTFYTIPVASVILLFLLSLMTGIFISLLIYQIRRLKVIRSSYATGSGGALLGILAPACSSCGVGLLAIFGFGGAIATLPFKGLEIGLLAVAILGVSIISVSGKICTKTCEPKRNSVRKLFRK